MAEELTITDEGKDTIAKIVAQRCRRSYDRQNDYIQYQGKTVWHLKHRAIKQYNREYIASDLQDFVKGFGFEPSRYYGITQQKVNATVDWCVDLVLAQLDAMATCMATPNPDIDSATVERIRFFLMQEIYQYAQDAGIADLNMLLTNKGKVDDRVKYFLQERAIAIKKLEQARIVSAASEAAKRMQTRMRDITLEGGFRQAYMGMKRDQALYGMGYMRFPVWQRKPYIEFTAGAGVKRAWAVIPTFKHVNIHDFFPVDDAPDLQTNTGNTEIVYVTKAEVIRLAGMKEYDKRAIEDVLEEYEDKKRDWIWIPQNSSDRNESDSFWDLDERIPMMIHEGYFSGSELSEYGIKGVDMLEYVDARVEVIGGRTVRCQLIKAPKGESRTYFGAPFKQTGSNIFDYVGIAGMLWDTEQEVNRLLHIFEHNIDWSARAPVLYNKSAFENPNDANNLRPGNGYNVNDTLYGTSGRLPDPVRTIGTVTAQYHLIMTQVQAFLRMADEACGIPAFAYSSQDMGKSSLGEYTQRMSNALRTIKGMAIAEDMYLIEPMFTGLFEYLMIKEPELREGQDINLQVRGITGLLKEDMQAQKQAETLPLLMQASQSIPGLQAPLSFALRQLLEQAGFPVDALGMTDPVMENALAVAASQPLQGYNPAGQQVPSIDGRSGNIPAANVAQTNGLSNANLAQVAPM